MLNNLFKVCSKWKIHVICYKRRHYFLCNKEMPKNPKNWWKPMKIVNIAGKNLHIFWTTWEISMKSLGKMWLMMIIIKVPKNQGFTLSLEDKFFEKPQDWSNWLPLPAVLGLNTSRLSYLSFTILTLNRWSNFEKWLYNL